MAENGTNDSTASLGLNPLQDIDDISISTSPLNLHTLLDIEDFSGRVVGGYNTGIAETGLPADVDVARSLIGLGTGVLRDFSYIAPEIPEFIEENCVGCMDCVTECPDIAILGKITTQEELDKALAEVTDPDQKEFLRKQFAETSKYYTNFEKKGKGGAHFGIFIDPTKCKGCAECVEVCGDGEPLRWSTRRKRTSRNSAWPGISTMSFPSLPRNI